MLFLSWSRLPLVFYTIINLSTTSKSETTFGGIKSGRHSIVHCSHANATHLSHIIQLLNSAIFPAVTDTERLRPSAAYITFFSDVSYSAFVRDILMMVTTGISLDKQGSPIFWCLQGPGEIRYLDRHSRETGDMYTRCQQHPEGLLQGMHGTRYIVVCPQFYTLPITDTPPEGKCLSVEHNRFKSTGWEMGFFRMWLVLEELVQYYVYAITGSETEEKNVNKASWLGGKASTRNARNYVYYVANIYGNCTDFPNLPVARPPDRELLASPDNSTNEPGAAIVPDVQNVTISS